MPGTRRARRVPRQSSSLQPIKQCRYCKEDIRQHLAQHEHICRLNAKNRREALDDLRRARARGGLSQNPAPAESVLPADGATPGDVDIDMDDSLLGTDPPHPSSPLPGTEPENVTVLPRRFIYVKHHAHAQKEPEIINLDEETPQPESLGCLDPSNNRPWAPFGSYHDYKFASRCVKRRTPNAQIDEDLRDLHEGAYSTDCLVKFHPGL
ncbi:hypothetical protein FB45DRAFT_878743 [Roridomyces roridus]|uniref:Uncharacterized protein n=1 Tax=Roridomyces roridus TaxID=1738132 RepID=A0AAD7B0A1_9AGAR|nr:hypothetical protein FB45DRAFT_878743 [Roridomyces roridus]